MPNTLLMIVKLIAGLIVVLPLIYFTLKYGGKKYQSMQNNSYLKILERLSISKDNSLLVVKIGQKGYVFTSTGNNIEMLMELDEKEVEKIEKTKNMPEYENMNDFVKDIKKKLNIQEKIELLKKLKIKKEG